MKREDKEELDATIEALENESFDAEREEELHIIVDRLCEMSDSDYRKFVRFMRYERKARKQLGNMSQLA